MTSGSVDEIVDAVARIAHTFGGSTSRHLRAPVLRHRETKLRARLDIPVFHDDQHGTAIVVLAGLLNAARVVGPGTVQPPASW